MSSKICLILSQKAIAHGVEQAFRPAAEASPKLFLASQARGPQRALRVAGKVEPVFVETVDEMPDAIATLARDGDVVITMGAGSIGGVCARLTTQVQDAKASK